MENHILIGLGGVGGRVLKEFKKRLFLEFTPEERAQLPIGFLYVDASNEMMQPGDKSWLVHGENAQFNGNEFLFLRSIQWDAYFETPNLFPGLRGVIEAPLDTQRKIGAIGVVAGRTRRAGRILFGGHAASYRNALRRAYQRVSSISGCQTTHLHIIGGLGGATGSGAIIDAITQARMLSEFAQAVYPGGHGGYQQANSITAYLQLPPLVSSSGTDNQTFRVNAYATLSELNALLTGNWKPFDVSGLSESGRIEYEPCLYFVNGIMLFSDTMENAISLEPFRDVPGVVANYLFTRLLHLGNKETRHRFIRETDLSRNMEPIEFYEKPGDFYVPYRFRNVGAFGIQRLVTPKEAIKDYLMYTIAGQVLTGLKYKHWTASEGWSKEPAQMSWDDVFGGRNPFEDWRMTDESLTLDFPVLPNDEGKWVPFRAYWNKLISQFMDMEVYAAENPIDKLNKLCSEAMECGFRDMGIEPFFTRQKEEKEKTVSEILGRIEHDLFIRWAQETLPMNTIPEIIKELITHCQQRIAGFDESALKLDAGLKGAWEEKRRSAASAYLNASFITRLLRKKQLLDDYAQVMTGGCYYRTLLESYSFAMDILHSLIAGLNRLLSSAERLNRTLDEGIQASDIRRNMALKNSDCLVSWLYDTDEVQGWVQEFITKRYYQDKMLREVMDEILRLTKQDMSFTRVEPILDTDTLDLIFNKTARKNICDTLPDFRFGILERLYRIYDSRDGIRSLAMKLLKNSGTMVQLNYSEIQRTVRNNHTPTEGANILRQCILVNLPSADGNPTIEAFSQQLKEALYAATPSGTYVTVNDASTCNTEISVISWTGMFPFRCLQVLKNYKDTYDYLTTPSDSISPSRAEMERFLFHTESFEKALPNLFVAEEKTREQLEAEYMPYVLLAGAMGLIRFGDLMDGTGRKAWGLLEVDEDLGLETIKPMADTFTGICASDAFTEFFCEDLEAAVKKELKNKYATRREELIPALQQLLNDTILPETGGNSASRLFISYIGHARTAKDLLKQE